MRTVFPDLPGAELVSEEKKAELLEDALAYVERRARSAPWIFLFTTIEFGVGTDWIERNPTVFWFFAILLCLVVVFRVAIQKKIRDPDFASFQTRVRLLLLGMCLTALCWGAFSLATYYEFGDGWLAAFCHVLLVFAALTTVFAYGPLIKVAIAHCIVLLLPGLVTPLIPGLGLGIFIFVGTIAFWVVFTPLLLRLHREYWMNVLNAMRLDRQTAELERAIVEAEQASRSKSEFLATVSHELRTPLSGILGTGSLLLQMPLGSAQREHAATMYRSASRLLRLIDDLLDVSRNESKRVRIENAPYGPTDLAEEVTRLFAPSAMKKGIVLKHDVAESLPQLLLGDAGRVRQVLANLVHNAVKFTERGKIVVDIREEFENDLRWVTFGVTDTGRGISAEQRTKLFQRYSQGEPAGPGNFSGSGLGLAISMELVEAMGGMLKCDSDLGSGTRFWFRLPLLEAAADANVSVLPMPIEASGNHTDAESAGNGAGSQIDSTSPPSAPEKSSEQPVVLVADDDGVLRKVVRLMLEQIGCQVHDAKDGIEACRLASLMHFDLVLMDCQMPNLDGYSSTARIRSSAVRADVPVVAMTANTSDEARQRCIAVGMNDVLIKPITLDTLFQTIDVYCEAPKPPKHAGRESTALRTLTPSAIPQV